MAMVPRGAMVATTAVIARGAMFATTAVVAATGEAALGMTQKRGWAVAFWSSKPSCCTLETGALLALPLLGARAARGLRKGRACKPEGAACRGATAAWGRGGNASCPLGEPVSTATMSGQIYNSCDILSVLSSSSVCEGQYSNLP